MITQKFIIIAIKRWEIALRRSTNQVEIKAKAVKRKEQILHFYMRVENNGLQLRSQQVQMGTVKNSLISKMLFQEICAYRSSNRP